MNFTSDNAYGAAPEIIAALQDVVGGTVAPYGEDEITLRVTRRLQEIFDCDLVAYPVFTGTAANALSLAAMCPPYGVIFCHETSHIAVDECAAPEFFTGGAKLVHLSGAGGKITPAAARAALANYRGGVHSPKPSVISITQATERGTVYRPEEIAALAGLAREEGMTLHMDGARFANALVHLDCAAADISWKAGVDVLSFGATKNGALCAEAVVFFNAALVRDFEYRRKRAGHLASKMRFVSAQLDAYLADDRWRDWARMSNALAQRLANAMRTLEGVTIVDTVEANELFAEVPTTFANKLRDGGAKFYDWGSAAHGRTLIRLVLSFLTPEADLTGFIALARS